MRRCCLFLSLANLTVGGAFVCRRHNNKRQVQLRRSGLMKLTTLTVAFAALTVCAQTAQAHEHHHRGYHHVARYHGHRSAFEADASYSGFGYSSQQYGATHLAGGAGPRPSAWCGWAMRSSSAAIRHVVQPRAQLGALGPFRPGRRRRGRRVAAPCRQDRRPGNWPVDHRVRQ